MVRRLVLAAFATTLVLSVLPAVVLATSIAGPNGKKLKPGSYRLAMTARDAGGLET
jgi:ABC-type transporter Mla subunit MlaD